ncbi:AI-2E family transporter [bacterium 1XD8-76]|nr:AI-2E family transporter [bacterium 1XD8-76]
MKKFTNKYMKWGTTALVVLILAICFVCLIFKGESIWNGLNVIFGVAMPVIDGLIIAFIAAPVLNWIEDRLLYPFCKKCSVDTRNTKVKKRIRAGSVLLTFLFIGIIIYSFFAIVIPELVLSVQSIITRFPTYINNLIDLTEKLLADNPDVEAYIESLLSTYSKDLDSLLDNKVMPTINNFILSASIGVIGMLKSLYNLVIGMIISVYVLSGKEKFASQAKKICYALFERPVASQVINACRFTNKTFIGFLGGKIVDSAIIGVLCFFGTSILKMPYAVLISVIVGVTNIIPFFGPYIGAIPSALLVLMINPVKCIPFILFVLALQQLDGNVIGPKILGESTGLSGFWVIFSITFFGGLWGIAGMVVGVPLFAVLYAGISYLINKLLEKKALSTNTEDYEGLDHISLEKVYVPMQDTESSKKSQSGKAKESTEK